VQIHGQIRTRFLPLAVMAVMALTAFSIASPLRAQGADDLNATPLSDVHSVLQADSSSSSYVGDPFAKLFAGQAQDEGAAGGYPGSPKTGRSSPSEAPPHYEIEGFVQWRNLNESANINTSGTATGLAFNVSKDLGLSGQTPGFLFRFLWTPEKVILHASSLLRVEYGQIDRTKTHVVTGEITFEGQTYPIGAAIQTQLHNGSFEAAYAPLWGIPKFKIGPQFVFQDLIVNIRLAGSTLSSTAPVTVTSNNSNFVFQLGFAFDLTPVKQVDIYGHLGAIPCCGGGWTGTQSEFGVKFYVARSVSIIGGVRQNSLTRSFTAGPKTVNGETFGPVSASLGWSGVGPFFGASYRF
jgi:hypothetical protein